MANLTEADEMAAKLELILVEAGDALSAGKARQAEEALDNYYQPPVPYDPTLIAPIRRRRAARIARQRLATAYHAITTQEADNG